jgi:protease PrsW
VASITASVPEPHEHFVRLPPRLWKLLFAGGLAIWLFSAVITEITGDTILVPTVIIVGSFLVPVTIVAFALSHRPAGYLTTAEVVLGFFAAGTLAVICSALLETYLLPASRGTFIGVGLFEELAKGAILLAVAHQVHHREPRDGMVLGVVVGAGFAAFESAGYAVQAMLNSRGDRIVDIVELEAFRAMLAPFGHITWTALVGGALFASSRGGRFHLTRRLGLTLLGVVTLHALWDQSYGWAVTLTKGLVEDTGWNLLWPNAQFWATTPPDDVMIWFNIFYNVLLWTNALVGATWLFRSWRSYGRRAEAEPPAPATYA